MKQKKIQCSRRTSFSCVKKVRHLYVGCVMQYTHTYIRVKFCKAIATSTRLKYILQYHIRSDVNKKNGY